MKSSLPLDFGLEYILVNSFATPASFSDFTKACGVYFLIKNHEIIYIGKSVNLRNRLNTHRRNIDFDRLFVITAGRFAVPDIEAHYIEEFQPRLNHMYNTNAPKKRWILDVSADFLKQRLSRF